MAAMKEMSFLELDPKVCLYFKSAMETLPVKLPTVQLKPPRLRASFVATKQNYSSLSFHFIHLSCCNAMHPLLGGSSQLRTTATSL